MDCWTKFLGGRKLWIQNGSDRAKYGDRFEKEKGAMPSHKLNDIVLLENFLLKEMKDNGEV